MKRCLHWAYKVIWSWISSKLFIPNLSLFCSINLKISSSCFLCTSRSLAWNIVNRKMLGDWWHFHCQKVTWITYFVKKKKRNFAGSRKICFQSLFIKRNMKGRRVKQLVGVRSPIHTDICVCVCNYICVYIMSKWVPLISLRQLMFSGSKHQRKQS